MADLVKFNDPSLRRNWTTGHKADPASVARSMMYAKDANGLRLFSSEEFLTSKQIAGFFSRLAAKKTLIDDEDFEEIEAATCEADMVEIVGEVYKELAPEDS